MSWRMGLVVLTLLLRPAPGQADACVPSEVVNGLHETFVDVLRHAEELRYAGRYERLAPAVGEAFDFEYMARLAIGREWKGLTAEQQARWVKAFGNFTVSNYAARLDHYSGQKFELLGTEDGAAGTIVARTRVIDPAGENVDLSYRLRKTESGCRVIDIYAKGTVSEIALRRSEYATILKRDGFDALVSNLDEKVRDLAAGKVAQ